MNNDDRAEFVRVLNGLAAVKRVDLTEEAYAMWWNAMGDWPLDQFRDAAGYLLKTCQFMPSPFDFEQLRKGPGAGEAWEAALEHAAGAWRKGGTGNELVDRAAHALGGYQVIAHCQQDKLGFLEKRFRDTYEEIQDAGKARKALPSVMGKTTIRTGRLMKLGEAAKLKAG